LRRNLHSRDSQERGKKKGPDLVKVKAFSKAIALGIVEMAI